VAAAAVVATAARGSKLDADSVLVPMSQGVSASPARFLLKAAAATRMMPSVIFRVAPRLKGVLVPNEAISLELADCYVGITNAFEWSEDLRQASRWQTIITFVSTSPETNWSAMVPTSSTRAFDRLVRP
jgi:hypothetical protein